METVVADVIAIIEEGRRKAYTAVNTAMVEAYWLSGRRRIVEEEQGGQERAAYGKKVIMTVSERLTARFGRGYSETNVRNFRLFYLTFPNQDQIQQTLSAKLSWSHFQLIMRVSDSKARNYYRKEASEQNWGVRSLDQVESDRTIAKYSVLNESKQLFASKYLPYLPTEEELAAEIEAGETDFQGRNRVLWIKDIK